MMVHGKKRVIQQHLIVLSPASVRREQQKQTLALSCAIIMYAAFPPTTLIVLVPWVIIPF